MRVKSEATRESRKAQRRSVPAPLPATSERIAELDSLHATETHFSGVVYAMIASSPRQPTEQVSVVTTAAGVTDGKQEITEGPFHFFLKGKGDLHQTAGVLWSKDRVLARTS